MYTSSTTIPHILLTAEVQAVFVGIIVEQRPTLAFR